MSRDIYDIADDIVVQMSTGKSGLVWGEAEAITMNETILEP